MLEIKNNIAVCTVAELASYLAESVNTDCVVESNFRDCDFAIYFSDECDTDYMLDYAAGWHGVKRVPDIGFDSDCLMIAADCYGGGSLTVTQFWPAEINTANINGIILDTILSSVNMSEYLESDSEILVRFK